MTEVIMPQMGESIAEGTIIKWYKSVGDSVERDEPLFEISTDKVDTEIPSPTAGVLSEIRVQEGETVPINTVVAILGEAGAAGAGSAPSSASRAEPSPSASAPAARPSPPPAPPAPSANVASNRKADAGEDRGPRSSPLVRRMAREHELDLTRLTGSGRGGRITKQDVLRHLDESARPEAPPPAPPAPEPAGFAAAGPAPSPEPATSTSEPPPTSAHPATSTPSFEGRAEIEPMSGMRKSIAEHMIASRRTSAHVTTVFEADVTRIVRAREQYKAVFEQQEGVKLTYTPFFVRALVGSLKAFPILNASLDGDRIVYKKEYHIGVAVALEGGLIVPVIRAADEKSFLGLSRAVNDLAERARTKKLKPDEVQGGTFTITNPGPYGGLFGTPIINQPQVAILGLGGIHKRPVVVNDAIAVRSMIYLALSFDHRLIDGALADRFMADLKRRLEAWDEKIL